MKIGLVLSGGGSRGIAHIGILKAFQELKITIHCIAGTSAGAIVGALFSYGYSPKEILEIITSISVFKSIQPSWTRTGLLKMEALRKVLIRWMPENDFNCLKIPMTVAATDLRLGAVAYFNSGELSSPIMASCCVPAIFAPVTIEGKIYVDGGILDNLPAKPIASQCDFLIGSHCNPISANFDGRNLKSIIERSLLMAINNNTLQSKKLCHILVEPPELSRISGFDIGKARNIFEMGYQYVMRNFKVEQFQPAK